VTVRLVPTTNAVYDAWAETAVADYAQQHVDSGISGLDAALRDAHAQFAELLPEGVDTADHLFFTAYDADTPVGMIWVWLGEIYGARSFVYDIVVDAAQRRRGYGRAILAAIEDELRGRGIGSIALNVFGTNTGARALYESVGYDVVRSEEQDGRVVAVKMRHEFSPHMLSVVEELARHAGHVDILREQGLG
jgi:ribosomal protein S18 acetylase RimI-like enzyme